MGLKKKKNTSKHRLPSPSIATTSSTATIISDELRSILERALQLAKDCKFDEANSLINNICCHPDSSAICHCVNAALKFAFHNCIIIHFNQHYNDTAIQAAIASARQATILSPSNLEYSLFYALLLIISTQNYQEASKICERALRIPNSIAPTSMEFLDFLNFNYNVSHVTTAEGRINCYRQELRNLSTFATKLNFDNAVQNKKKLINSKKPVKENPRKARVQTYLESLTPAEVRTWIELDLQAFMRHSMFYRGAYHVLLESLDFFENSQTWEFCACPFCYQKFRDSHSHLLHVMNKHVFGVHWDDLKKQLPQPINQEWAEKLVNGNWVPIDVDTAVKLFEQMPEWGVWPLSNNAKRIELLQIIGDLFQILVKYKCLAVSHLKFVLNYAMEQIQAHPTAYLLANHGVNEQSTLCIRVLDVFHLKKVLVFLEIISEACELGRNSNKESLDDDHDVILDASASDMMENILLDHSASRLVLDPRAFCKKEDHSMDNRSGFDDWFDCVLDVETLVSWLYKGDSWNESYFAWNESRTSKTSQSNEILQKLQMEYHFLHDLCTKKQESLVYVGALKHAEDLCRYKLKKGENAVESEFPSYEAILRKEKEERAKESDAGSEVMVAEKAISDVLEIAQKVKPLDILNNKVQEFNSEDDDTSVLSSLNDLNDICIEKAFKILSVKESLKQNKIDANIMMKLHRSRQLEIKLGPSSSLKFLTILIPLVKSFLQMHLEEAAENIAIDKTDAAYEAILAEECDAQKTDKGGTYPKQTHGKSKGKKKSNHSKESMVIKAANSNENHLQQETEVQIINENQKKGQARSYLESLTPAANRTWIEVGVKELEEYCTFSTQAYDVLMEALPFAEVNYTWKFWTCPVCYEKFADSDSHLQHVVSEHVGPVLSDELRKQLPQSLNQDWVDKLVNGSWEPIGVELLENMPECDVNAEDLVSNDAVRTKILQRIGAVFRMLVKYDYLAIDHLVFVLTYAMEQVRGHLSASLLMKHSINEQSTLSIRVLDDFHLTKILVFLQNLSEACELGIHFKKESFHDDHNAILDAPDSEVLVRILLDHNLSKLILDPRAFCKQVDHNKDNGSCIDDGLKCVIDVEAVVSWLYKGSWNESYFGWNECRVAKTNRSKEILQTLQVEYNMLHDLCTKKHKCLVYTGALMHAEDLCRDILKKRENNVETEFPSYEAILRKQKEECVKKFDAGSDVMVVVKTISDVLKMAQKVKKLDISNDKSLDLDSDDDYTSVSSSFNDLEDICIEKSFQILREKQSLERNKIDVNIMKKLHCTRQLQHKLGPSSSLNFLTILTPLVKSFLQKLLEEAAENLAIDKTDAGCEALLAEEHDARKTDKGGNYPKQSQGKFKGKKKSNHSKKSTGIMAASSTGKHLQQVTEVQIELPPATDGNTSNSAHITSDPYLKEQDDRYRVMLEEDDRKVTEYLEFQKRVENESKQKILAQQKNALMTPPDNSDVVAD